MLLSYQTLWPTENSAVAWPTAGQHVNFTLRHLFVFLLLF